MKNKIRVEEENYRDMQEHECDGCSDKIELDLRVGIFVSLEH